MYSPFLRYRLISSLEIINFGNTGNPNHPDLEVLAACISKIIDFLVCWDQADNAKVVNTHEQLLISYLKNSIEAVEE